MIIIANWHSQRKSANLVYRLLNLSYTVGMSRYILMSIQTRYAEKIFRGEKRWEFRKSLPRHSKDDELTVVVYSSGVTGRLSANFGLDVSCAVHWMS